MYTVNSIYTTKYNSYADLTDAVPVQHDEFCQSTKDLVAMRCSEKLYASSTLESRVVLDSQRTCQGANLTWTQIQMKNVQSHSHKCRKINEKEFSHII